MAARIPQILGWCWRLCGAALAVKVLGGLEIVQASVKHHPIEATIVGVALGCLALGCAGLFWRRGAQLIHPEIPWGFALIWVPFRTLLETLALAFFVVGLAVVLLQLLGGEAVQISMTRVSLAHHLTTEHTGWSTFVNWTLHSSAAAFIYGSGLRVNDLLKRLTGVQDPMSPRRL